jgi:hypothetical protein
MFKILQENGEVVLCVGSSLNMVNTPMFLQADCRYGSFVCACAWKRERFGNLPYLVFVRNHIEQLYVCCYLLLFVFSIAIEPPYPQLCACSTTVVDQWNRPNLSPTELASRLMALPCSLAFQREDNVSLLQLIAEVTFRHTCSSSNTLNASPTRPTTLLPQYFRNLLLILFLAAKFRDLDVLIFF